MLLSTSDLNTLYMIITVTIIVIISAIGDVNSGPIIPNFIGKIITSATLSTKSLSKESPNDRIGFPIACKKILVDFIIAVRIILLKNMRNA